MARTTSAAGRELRRERRASGLLMRWYRSGGADLNDTLHATAKPAPDRVVLL